MLKIGSKFADVFKTSYTDIKVSRSVIVDFHIKIFNLVKCDPETSFIPFCQKNAFHREHFSLRNPVQKIEIMYVHKIKLEN